MNASTNKPRTALKVTTGLKAGGLNAMNHNRPLTVASGVKAGGIASTNHNRALLAR